MIQGKTVGVLGVGAIAEALAPRLKALGLGKTPVHAGLWLKRFRPNGLPRIARSSERWADAAARVLDRLGITLLPAPAAGCCGAVSQHLDAPDEARDYMRRNIDAWWPYIENGAEAIVMTASGCATMVADYGLLLAHDAAYAGKAARVSALMKEISEVIAAEKSRLRELLSQRPRNTEASKVAFHPPCSLQHGLKMKGRVEPLLQELGFELTPVADSHLCCGSAGSYSLLQPELSLQLRDRKLANLADTGAQTIVSANVGCTAHLQSGTGTPVLHWIELIDRALN